MSPIDDELRSALRGRAATVAASPDPLAGIEHRATRMRRTRTAAAVAASALAVAAIAVAVPALAPSAATAPIGPAATPSASADASLRAAEFSFAEPWRYRGDASLVTAAERETYTREWAATQGAPASAVQWLPLFGRVDDPSGLAEVVYAARVGTGAPVVGLAVATEAGPEYRSERPFTDGGDSLLLLRLGGELLLALAAPGSERLEYAADGQSFRDMTTVADGVGLTPLEVDVSRARVRLTVNGGFLTAEVPAAEPTRTGPPTAPGQALPDNLLDWPSRGDRSQGPNDEQVLLPFAQSITGTVDPEAPTSYRALFSGSTDAGVRFTYGQAWADGQPAYTVGLATGGTQGDQFFLGPVTPGAPSVLAFVLCCQPGSSVDTLVVVPVPGTGQVHYDDDATGAFRPVGVGQDFLDGVVLVDRDPRAQADRLQLLDGDGDLDAPTFQGPVFPLLCGLTECG